MKILNILFLSILFVSAAIAQKPADPVAEYKTAAAKCRELFQKEANDEAEKACKSALDMAEKLPAGRLSEKLTAHENYGLYLYFAEKHNEAEVSFMDAMDIGMQMPPGSAELANVYFNLGRNNFASNLYEIADEYYSKSYQTYRIAFGRTKAQKLKRQYMDSMEFLLSLRLALATQSHNEGRIKEVRTQIKLLPRF